MSMESDLVTALKVRCARVYPDVAPHGAARPYVTWQAIGGEVARYIDNTAADKRNTVVQVNAWADTRVDALTLIRQIEDDLCASSAFVARPQGESMAMHEPETNLYGCVQRYSIWAAR